jgi:protein SCO1/2
MKYVAYPSRLFASEPPIRSSQSNLYVLMCDVVVNHLMRKYPLYLAMLAVVACASLGCGRKGRRGEQQALGVVTRLGTAALTDQEGRTLKLAEFHGKLLVLSFFFTSCPTVCPVQTQALSNVQRRLSAALRQRVRFLSLSVDPENDTPEALKSFAMANGADLSGWSFVRASLDDTHALTTELAAFDPRAEGPSAPSGHTMATYLFDGRGRLMQRYAGSPLDVPRLAREIEQLDAWFQETKDPQ